MWTLRWMALVLAVFVAACTESPTWPPPQGQTPQQPQKSLFLLSGHVTDGTVPVVGALVWATSTGTSVNTATDSQGGYRLQVAQGNVMVEVTSAGFSSLSKQLTVDRDMQIDFLLEPVKSTTVEYEGDYQLTVTPSASCSLPPEVSQRTYRARITEESRGSVTVLLSGAVLLGDPPGFQGTRDGTALRFALYNGYDGQYWFIENIGEKNLFFEGDISATIHERSITGTLVGEIRYFVVGGSWLGQCSAAEMTFTR